MDSGSKSPSPPPSGQEPMSHDAPGKWFKHREFNNSDYYHEEIYLRLSQIRDMSNPLRDIDTILAGEIETDMEGDGKFDYGCGLMSVVFRKGDICSKSKDSDLFTTHKDKDGRVLRLLKIAHNCTIADGRHRRFGLRSLSTRIVDGKNGWTKGFLRVQLIRRKDGKPMTAREILFFSSQKNTKSTRVRRDTSILSFLGRVMAYSHAFLESYDFTFLEASTECISKDMESIDFLNGLQRDSYKRYIRLAKTVLRYPKVQDFLHQRFKAVAESSPSKTYITYITDGKLLGCNEEDMLILLEAAVRFIENPDCTLFTANLFFAAGLNHLHSLQDYYQKLLVQSGSKVQRPVPKSFADFFVSEFSGERNSVTTVSNLFYNHVLSINFRTHRYSEQVESVMMTRRKRLLKQLDGFYIGQTTARNRTKGKIGSGLSTGNIIRRGRRERNSGTTSSQPQPPLKKTKTVTQYNKTSSGKSGGLKKPQKSQESTSDSSSSSDTTSEEQGIAAATKAKNDEQRPNGQFESNRQYETVPHHWSNRTDALKKRKPLDGLCTREWLVNCRRHPSFRNDQIEKDMDASLQYEHNGETITDVSPYLRACLIPEGHHSHVYLNKEDVLNLRDLAWKWAHVKEMYRLSSGNKWNCKGTTSLEDMWQEGSAYAESPLGISLFARKKAELDNRGYTILENMADLSQLQNKNGKAANTSTGTDVFMEHSLEQLFTAVQDTFPGEEVVARNENEERLLWNPIVNIGNGTRDRNNNDCGRSRFSSTEKLLEDKLGNSDENNWFAPRRSALDVWIGWLLALLNLDSDGERGAQVPRTGGRFLLTGEGCPDQTGHNDFPTEKRNNPGYFCITTSQEQTSLFVCPSSHQYVWYDEEDRISLARMLKMTEITIPARSIFIGHGLLQHAGCGWLGFQALRYHMYIIPTGMEMEDSVFYAFGSSLQNSNNRRLHNIESCSLECMTSSLTSQSITRRTGNGDDKRNEPQDGNDVAEEVLSSHIDSSDDEHCEIQNVTIV